MGKGVDSRQVISRLSSLYDLNDPIDRMRVNEVLWRVDERVRQALESKLGGNDKAIHEAIIRETCKLLLKHSQKATDVDSSLGWQILLHEAACGRMPRETEIAKMKEFTRIYPEISCADKVKQFSIDKSINRGITEELFCKKTTSSNKQNEQEFDIQHIEIQIERIKATDRQFDTPKNLEKNVKFQ